MTPTPYPIKRGYFHLQLGQARQALAERLGDPGNVYWPAQDLIYSIAEALHAWQAYTNWYRERAILTTQQDSLWYDLTQDGVVLPQGPSFNPNLFGYNITAQALASQILYQICEPQLVSNGATLDLSGSGQFDLAQIQNAIQNRVNRFLGDSGAVTSYLLQESSVPPTNGRALLPDSVIDIRRVVWIDQPNPFVTNRCLLWREDEWALNSFMSGWQGAGYVQPGAGPQYPSVYSVALTPPVSIQIAALPTNPGALEIHAVQSGPVIDLATPASVDFLGVPDDFVWAVKWGALADLLSGDGQARDTLRAQYCQSRYLEAVQLARSFPAVMQTLVNGIQIPTESAFDLDSFLSSWQNSPASIPQFCGLVGRNLLALAPQAAPPANVVLDLARNMPIPTEDGDFLQVPRDVEDVILDEAQHIASWKMGGEEFLATQALHNNFLVAAGDYNARLKQLAFYQEALRQPSLRQGIEVRRL